MTAPMHPPTDEQTDREVALYEAVTTLIKAAHLAAGGHEGMTGAILIQAAAVWWYGHGHDAKGMSKALRAVAGRSIPWAADAIDEIKAELEPVLQEMRLKHAAGIPTKGGDS